MACGSQIEPQSGGHVSTALCAIAALMALSSVEVTGLAEVVGIPSLAGPSLLAAIAYGLTGLVLFGFLGPDPFLVAGDSATTPEPRRSSDMADAPAVQSP